MKMFYPLRLTARSATFLVTKLSRCAQKRSKKKWVTAESSALQNDPTRLALNQFDQQYKAQFNKDWPSIRMALLSLQKYGAQINNFCNEDEAIQKLSDLGADDFVQSATQDLRAFYVEQWKERLHDIKESDVGNEYAANYANEAVTIDSDGEQQENVEDQGQRAAGSWKDEYIVASGYESKLEYMIGRDADYDHLPGVDLSVAMEIIHKPITINPSLKCFVFPEGNFNRFPPSKLDSYSGLLLYYAIDASSLLPVMALDIQPDDSVLDMCAAPGGKALTMLNLLDKGGIVLNEPSTARRRRLLSVLESYVPHKVLNSGTVEVTSVEGQEWGSSVKNTFDKILVDVPCTTDRLSLKEKNNNIFRPKISQERWNLPSLQEELLCSALLSVKPGGDVVYSTCSLSSLQNDGVVQGAILKCKEEYDINVKIVDLSPLKFCTSSVFRFSDTTKYGQLVLPDLKKNFGPMYFARLYKDHSVAS